MAGSILPFCMNAQSFCQFLCGLFLQKCLDSSFILADLTVANVVGSNLCWLVWFWLVVCFQLRLYGLQGILWGLSPPLPFNLLCYVNVTSIFKKGNLSFPAISGLLVKTSVMSKVEFVVKDYVLKYLSDNGLLHLSQHGFLNKRSCVTNLLSFHEDVSLSLDSGHCVDVILP
ncbi:hypothetical protein HOLleu_27616 [Holothuria leucospilota]|uniref:Reverse transcriptase domain-containing protein n=1 Tax=Holothuria leucospilota TaxID=206669 RepID=A0A9Q1BR25_HOLLE|nr:hypothetical protein HOLleu_27616 [Holothuria leucospilota]